MAKLFFSPLIYCFEAVSHSNKNLDAPAASYSPQNSTIACDTKLVPYHTTPHHTTPSSRAQSNNMAGLKILAIMLCVAAGVEADLFHPGAYLTDTDGNVIRAHQPHVYSENGTFYLLGSAHVGASDGAPGIVNLYTSGDLHAWKFEGGVYNHTGDARPSLLGRNPRTGLYVLWAKGGSFQSATSRDARGPYTNVGNYHPEPSCDAGDSSAS